MKKYIFVKLTMTKKKNLKNLIAFEKFEIFAQPWLTKQFE